VLRPQRKLFVLIQRVVANNNVKLLRFVTLHKVVCIHTLSDMSDFYVTLLSIYR